MKEVEKQYTRSER